MNGDVAQTVRARLAAVTPAQRDGLRDATAALGAAAARDEQLVTWTERSGRGTSDRPLRMSYPVYAPEVDALIAAAYGTELIGVLDWMGWPGRERYRTPAQVQSAPVEDALRLLTAFVRGERFGDGFIAHALDNGLLLAAAQRVVAGF